VNESFFFLILTIFFPGMVLSQEKIKMNQKPSGNISLLKAQILSLPGCIVITLMDRGSLFSSLEIIYHFYNGGRRSSIVRQEKSGIDIANEESRQTDLQIVNDVKYYYYASVLSKNI
jgi:hypothetical protein